MVVAAAHVVQRLSRRLLIGALASGGNILFKQPCRADLSFLADDMTFTFELPARWVGATLPSEERASTEHLISVRAVRDDGAASVQAIVDGGIRGRRYGSSLADLGPLDSVANRLVSEELLNDDSVDN